MCRSIKQLRITDVDATDEEIHAAALQFVRKVSGYRKPSKINETTFNSAVEEISHTVMNLLQDLQSKREPKLR